MNELTEALLEPVPLVPGLKRDDWGMPGECWVQRFSGQSPGSGKLSEAWFGAHHKNPSSVLIKGTPYPLDALTTLCPRVLLGDRVIARFGTSYPNLGKGLSIGSNPRTILSIQVHPPQKLAEALHLESPELYPDPLPKDEASVALTVVELLYGMQRPALVREAAARHPEIFEILRPCEAGPSDAAVLREMHRRIFDAGDERIRVACQALYRRLAMTHHERLTVAERTIRELQPTYPDGDVGILFFFTMNYVRIAPGQGIAIPTGRVHTYTGGEMLEGMRGDNVIRAGCTTKPKNVEHFFAAAEFEPVDPREWITGGTALDAQRVRYEFGFDAFAIEIVSGPGEWVLHDDAPQILLSLDGAGSVANARGGVAIRPGGAQLLSAGSFPNTLKLVDGKIAVFKVGA